MNSIINVINFSQPVVNNFLVDVIIWLVSITSSVAVGIILFTLLLKIITLPFDALSKVSMRKNSLKMEQMRPELEKLQKQYANDKALYNQKMMALYKKNGYSMFGACLPTILTLVIFIVAISAFQSYSQYQNLTDFYNMSNAYNSAIYAGIETEENEDGYIVKDEKGKIVFDAKEFIKKAENGGETFESKDGKYQITISKVKTKESIKYFTFTTENGYIESRVFFSLNEEGKKVVSNTEYYVIPEKLAQSDLKVDGKKFSTTGLSADEAQTKAAQFLQNVCQQRSADKFREEQSSFLWVKNIWVTDSPLSHPVESKWDAFKSAQGYNELSTTNAMNAADYDNLIAKLEEEKTGPNGYFILAILTAGVTFLMQFVTTKSQKSQMELQTVNGQGMQSQKIMMWVMPILMTVFAFLYTSAFSIYMILSSAISIGSTLLINYLVDLKFNKKNGGDKKQVIHGRARDEKPVVKEKTEKEIAKEMDEGVQDFIKPSEDKQQKKKFIRGRLK